MSAHTRARYVRAYARADFSACSCALCGSKDPLEWDHTQALSTSFQEQTFQPICTQCHMNKTTDEPKNFGDPLASVFNPTVWKNYIETPRPPPLIHKVADYGSLNGCAMVDVRRCRKRALEMCSHPIPIFSCLDDIQNRTEYELGDLNFINRVATDPITQYGYTGPGWITRSLAEWFLHCGVIAWCHIPYVLNATARLPANTFERPLAKMESTDGETFSFRN